MSDTATAETEKVKKSIVPTRYANKYKGGGDGPTSKFIKEHSQHDGEFSFDLFFGMCRANGVPEDKVKHYEDTLDNPGVPGRARMTLGNMLRSTARKQQYLIGGDGEKVEVAEAPLPKQEKEAA